MKQSTEELDRQQIKPSAMRQTREAVDGRTGSTADKALSDEAQTRSSRRKNWIDSNKEGSWLVAESAGPTRKGAGWLPNRLVPPERGSWPVAEPAGPTREGELAGC